MVDQYRRHMVKSLPLLAGAAFVVPGVSTSAAHGGQDEGGRAGKKVVPGSSPNFSRVVRLDRMVFVSGVLGVDPDTRKLVSAEFQDQCRQVLVNLKASIEAGGSRLEQVLQCTCFLTQAQDFEAFNAIYREFFPNDPPARSTVVVKELVMQGARVEIDCIAHV